LTLCSFASPILRVKMASKIETAFKEFLQTETAEQMNRQEISQLTDAELEILLEKFPRMAVLVPQQRIYDSSFHEAFTPTEEECEVFPAFVELASGKHLRGNTLRFLQKFLDLKGFIYIATHNPHLLYEMCRGGMYAPLVSIRLACSTAAKGGLSELHDQLERELKKPTLH
jgi:hypothetical protein